MELLDIQKNPHELNIIYGTKENSKTTDQLKKELHNLIVQYQDDEALQVFEKGKKLILKIYELFK